MEFDLNDSLALLARTPSVVDSLLRGLPEAWTRCDEGAESWTPVDVVAHLLYTDHANWIPRMRLILISGDGEPFPPFKRFGHLEETKFGSLDLLLDNFGRTRARSIEEARARDLGPADLQRCGRHPALGAVTLAQLLAAWTVHDLTHLHQLTRLLAHQYRDNVGPFQKFLGVLQCGGHSAER